MASFDHTIPPGGEGKITLKVHTKGYQGHIHKSAKVNTNDSALKIFNLGIKAFVKVPISLAPRYVYLAGVEGQAVTREVQIKANLDKPLILTPSQFSLEGKLIYTIVEAVKGQEFKVRFTALPGPPQNYYGFLKLGTNYPETPEISIRIRGRFTGKKDER